MSQLISAMMALLIVGANAQCPPTYTHLRGRCLLFLDGVSQEFEDASDACDFYGGTLARVDDCHLLADIAKYITENGIRDNYWISATDIIEEGNFIWPDGTPLTMGAPFWGGQSTGAIQPDDGGGDCAVLAPLDGYYFHNMDCANQFSPLCQQDTSDGNCTSPFVPIAGGCFQYQNTVSVSWAEARGSCQASGGDLAIISDCSDMPPIISHIEDAGMSSYFWIGGSRTNGPWRWIDGFGMAMGPHYWGRNQTDGLAPYGGTDRNCVYLSDIDRHHFHDGSCLDTMAPLCETPSE